MTINGEEIETTPWHLFLTQDGWTEAEDLREGDAIVSLGGVYGTVDSVIIENTVQTMYDLTVEEVHTFAVGDGDWVVHNCNEIPQYALGNIGNPSEVRSHNLETLALYNPSPTTVFRLWWVDCVS